MKTSYGEVQVDYIDFADVDVRIANRTDALNLLDDMIDAGTVENQDVALEALRDAIAREVV